MFKSIANYIINGKIREQSAKIKKNFVEWSGGSLRVVIIGRGQDSEKFRKFIKEHGKKTEIVVFNNDKITQNGDCFLSLNKKDLNFFGLPNAEAIEKIKKVECDLLINCDLIDELIMKALTGLINAKCKVGRENLSYNKLFDFSMVASGNDSLEGYLKEAVNYLKMIRTN